MRNEKAFTLIELLIVVAIIAILAAIAVPNFLEAQTRAKVSRVKSDLRSVATGLESYFIDNNSYPCDQDDNPYGDRWDWEEEAGLLYLTTPVSYMSAVSWNDPFSKTGYGSANNMNGYAPIYQMASGVNPERRDKTIDKEKVQAYCLFSVGPDQQYDMIDDDWPWNATFDEALDNSPSGMETADICAIYDPTNGTTSRGELVRFGGDYNAGDWRIYDGLDWVDHGEWNLQN